MASGHTGRSPNEASFGERGLGVELLIRSAAVEDLGAIRDIYNYYVTRSTCTFQIEPDTEVKRLAWFRDRSPAHPVIVAEAVSEVVGWAALSPWNPRCAYTHAAA